MSFAEKDERRFRLFGGRSSNDNTQNNQFGKSSQFEITITQENNKSYVRAISKLFVDHKKIARYTFPIWMYIAVTGVIVYLI